MEGQITSAEIIDEADSTDSPGVDLPPGQLIVTLFGLYARSHDGWLSVASLVRLMRDLGVGEPLTRSALSRLKRRAVVHSVRRDGQSGYALSANSVRVLVDGDARIFGRRRATVDDGWVLVAFSVPEMQRERRHVLRSTLIRLGFGTVSAGIWIAPGHLEAEARAALHRLDLTSYVDVFRSTYVAFGDARTKVATWWDLDELTSMYGTFIERFTALRADIEPNDDGSQAFRQYVPMLTSWRRLPYSDPGLPLALLPSPWNGSVAEDLFSALDQSLRGPAQEYATSLLG